MGFVGDRMNPSNVKLIAVAFVAVLVCAGASYAMYGIDDGEDIRTSPWSLSNVVGMMPDERPDAVDDFFVNVNYENSTLQPGYMSSDTLNDLNAQAQYQLLALSTTAEPTGHAHEILLAAVASYADSTSRDAFGMSELEPHVSDLMAAESLEDLTAEEFSAASPLFEADIARDLDPAGIANARVTYGGTGHDAVVVQLGEARAALEKDEAGLA